MLLKVLLLTITFTCCMLAQVESLQSVGIPLNPDFYRGGPVGNSSNRVLFCEFPYYDPQTNLTILRPPDSTINTFFCPGLNNHLNVTNITTGPVLQFLPGLTVTFLTQCPIIPTENSTVNVSTYISSNCSYDYQLIATDSTFTPISSFLNVTLPGQANGSIPFGGSYFSSGEDTFRLSFYYGQGLFFYKEVLSGNLSTYGVLNISCPLNEDGTPDDYCTVEASSVPGYKKHLSDFISWFTLALLWISIGGSLMTLLTFTVHHEILTYPIKLIMYLCVCIILGDFFFLMGFEAGFQKNDAVCYLTGMTIHGFFLGNFCWTLCIAFNFYQMIVRRNRESESLEKFYHLFSWGFPIFCVEWVGGWEYYGLQNGAVCYVTDPYFLFAFFFLPGLIILALNIILFFFVAREIHDTLASAPASDKKERRKECRVYVSICISIGLSWVFGFIMILFTVYWINLIFLFLFTIFTGLQGFLIFISYCVNKKVAGKWAGLLGKCIPFFRGFEHMDTKRSTNTDSNTSSSRGTSSTNSAETSADSEMSSTTDD